MMPLQYAIGYHRKIEGQSAQGRLARSCGDEDVASPCRYFKICVELSLMKNRCAFIGHFVSGIYPLFYLQFSPVST